VSIIVIFNYLRGPLDAVVSWLCICLFWWYLLR